jgi:hypothetical protein
VKIMTIGDYKTLATDFASALVAKDWDRAYAMTTPSYRKATSLKAMRREFEEMIEDIEPVGPIHLMNTMEDWPAKEKNDVGWAYVAIDGEGWGEAVTVIVARSGKGLAIRDVEWGRP